MKAPGQMAKRRRRPNQMTHGLSYTHEYRVWQTMRLRCTEPANAAYPSYGGRGITICDRWLNSPASFIADVGPRPSTKHEIDRIDNNRGYELDNVRWVTRKENCRNRRSCRWVELDGQRRTLAEWCELLNLPQDTIAYRLNKGWSAERALKTPVRAKISVRQGTMTRAA